MQSTSERFHGTMHTWSGKGYGFIRRDDKQPDVFVHSSDVMEFMGDQLEVGQRVTFELGQDPKSGKTKAVNVRISIGGKANENDRRDDTDIDPDTDIDADTDIDTDIDADTDIDTDIDTEAED